MSVPDRLSPGEYLVPRGRIFAPNGEMFLAAQTDGNVVVYRTQDGASLWSTGQLGIARFTMQPDGNIVGTDSRGAVVWASNTDGHPGASLVAQDDGNVVALDANGNPYWDTGTNGFTGTRSGNQRGALRQVYDAASDAVDEVKAVLSEIPGVDWAAGLIEDFAKTDLGKAFLRFASPLVLPILAVDPFTAPILFGIVSGVAFALPGLARGEPLGEAYANELKAAAQQVGIKALNDVFPAAVAEAEQEARDLGKLAGEFPQDVAGMITRMGENYGLPKPVDISSLANAFAAKMGIRQDLARVALDQVLGLDPFSGDDGTNPLSGHFSSDTGEEKRKKTIHFSLLPLTRPRKSTATVAFLQTLSGGQVSRGRAVAASNLAHDALTGRAQSANYANFMAQGRNVDGEAVSAAMALHDKLQARRAFVDRYTRGTKG